MIKHSLRQCCGAAKSARPVAWARIGNTAVTALSVMFSLPGGWVAAQDVGGKAPLGEEVLEPDAAEPDRDAAEPDMVERGWLEGDTATGDWGGLRTKLAEQGITFEGGLVADFLALARGGASGGGNWDYAGYTYLGATFDLATLADLPGLVLLHRERLVIRRRHWTKDRQRILASRGLHRSRRASHQDVSAAESGWRTGSA